MDLGPHAFFIWASYAVSALIVGGLMLWILMDYRSQRRALQDFEARGITRRSAEAAAGTDVPQDSR